MRITEFPQMQHHVGKGAEADEGASSSVVATHCPLRSISGFLAAILYALNALLAKIVHLNHWAGMAPDPVPPQRS